jgi:hypothetical protein
MIEAVDDFTYATTKPLTYEGFLAWQTNMDRKYGGTCCDWISQVVGDDFAGYWANRAERLWNDQYVLSMESFKPRGIFTALEWIVWLGKSEGVMNVTFS